MRCDLRLCSGMDTDDDARLVELAHANAPSGHRALLLLACVVSRRSLERCSAQRRHELATSHPERVKLAHPCHWIERR